MASKSEIQSELRSIQDEICVALENLDGQGKFSQDTWTREGGGGGITRIIQGKHIEKGGVNFSAVHGEMNEAASKSLGIETKFFFATGISIVLHPINPFIPVIHMNVRFFEGDKNWWYGGGIDVTPHYIDQDEASKFHNQLKEVCNLFNPQFYPEFKMWADDYFYLKHRKETRGIGGIFFDRLTEPEISKNEGLQFITTIAKSFIAIYSDLFIPNYLKPYEQKHIDWQLLRRGRYVEFNLLWDRGTKFGLETDGRTESILMSLPKNARWEYNHCLSEDSEEWKTQNQLKKNIDWINIVKKNG